MTEKTNRIKRMRAVPMHIKIAFAGSTAPNVRPSDFVLPGVKFRNNAFVKDTTIVVTGEARFGEMQEHEDEDRNP